MWRPGQCTTRCCAISALMRAGSTIRPMTPSKTRAIPFACSGPTVFIASFSSHAPPTCGVRCMSSPTPASRSCRRRWECALRATLECRTSCRTPKPCCGHTRRSTNCWASRCGRFSPPHICAGIEALSSRLRREERRHDGRDREYRGDEDILGGHGAAKPPPALRRPVDQGGAEPPLVRGGKPHQHGETDDFGDEQFPVGLAQGL